MRKPPCKTVTTATEHLKNNQDAKWRDGVSISPHKEMLFASFALLLIAHACNAACSESPEANSPLKPTKLVSNDMEKLRVSLFDRSTAHYPMGPGWLILEKIMATLHGKVPF